MLVSEAGDDAPQHHHQTVSDFSASVRQRIAALLANDSTPLRSMSSRLKETTPQTVEEGATLPAPHNDNVPTQSWILGDSAPPTTTLSSSVSQLSYPALHQQLRLLQEQLNAERVAKSSLASRLKMNTGEQALLQGKILALEHELIAMRNRIKRLKEELEEANCNNSTLRHNLTVTTQRFTHSEEQVALLRKDLGDQGAGRIEAVERERQAQARIARLEESVTEMDRARLRALDEVNEREQRLRELRAQNASMLKERHKGRSMTTSGSNLHELISAREENLALRKELTEMKKAQAILLPPSSSPSSSSFSLFQPPLVGSDDAGGGIDTSSSHMLSRRVDKLSSALQQEQHRAERAEEELERASHLLQRARNEISHLHTQVDRHVDLADMCRKREQLAREESDRFKAEMEDMEMELDFIRQQMAQLEQGAIASLSQTLDKTAMLKALQHQVMSQRGGDTFKSRQIEDLKQIVEAYERATEESKETERERDEEMRKLIREKDARIAQLLSVSEKNRKDKMNTTGKDMEQIDELQWEMNTTGKDKHNKRILDLIATEEQRLQTLGTELIGN